MKSQSNGDTSYKVSKSLTELVSNVIWKIEVVRNETGYVGDEFSKQRVDKTCCFFFLAASDKI